MISRSLWVISTTVTPWAFSLRNSTKSPSASAGVSTAVGSSRISTAGAAQHRLHDLDALLQPDAELAHGHVGVDREAVVAGEIGHPRPDGAGAAAQQRGRPRRRA